MITVETIFDDFIQYENLRNNGEKKEKKDRFLKLFCEQLTEDKLIYFVHNDLSSNRSYSKERFLELCIENNIIDRKLLTALFLHVHSKAHLYSYFRNCQFSEEKILSFFEKIEKPFLCFQAKNKFNCLSDEFHIYRGLYSKPTTIDQMGYCWTLKENIAERFALCNPNSDIGFIIKGTAKKEDVYGYILSRGEEEIIIDSKLVLNKELKEVSRQG